MPPDELPDLVDRVDRIQVALPLRLPPGKQSVPAQHDPVAARILLDRPLHRQRQFEPRPLPRQPHQPVPELAIELFHLGLAVGRGRQRNRPVRMQVVHVRKRQKSVQRSIDRGRYRIRPERAQRIEVRHLVFPLDALIALLERQQLLLVERGKARALDAAQVPARTLHPKHLNPLARQRIGLQNLRAGIAAGKVGNAQVRAQQVRPIPQQLGFVERRRHMGVPTVLKKCQYRGRDCSLVHAYQFTRIHPAITNFRRRKTAPYADSAPALANSAGFRPALRVCCSAASDSAVTARWRT